MDKASPAIKALLAANEGTFASAAGTPQAGSGGTTILETGTTLAQATGVRYSANGVVFGVSAGPKGVVVHTVRFGSGRTYDDYTAAVYVFRPTKIKGKPAHAKLGPGEDRAPSQDDICARQQWAKVGSFRASKMVAKTAQEIAVIGVDVPGQ